MGSTGEPRDTKLLGAGCVTLGLDVARGIVRLRVRGKLTIELAEQAQLEASRSHPGHPRLWDFGDADLSDWTPEEMRGFARVVGGREASSIRVAALAPRDLEYGLCRMYEALAADQPNVEYRSFRDEAEATSWLLAAVPGEA